MISNTVNTNFGKLMDELQLDSEAIKHSFGPYSKCLTLQKNVIIASGRFKTDLGFRPESRSIFKLKREDDNANILRNTVLVYFNASKVRVQYVFYFYHDTIGSIVDEIFYEALKDNLKPFTEINVPHYLSACYGEGLEYIAKQMSDADFKKATLDILEEYRHVEYIYASRCFPSMCSYVIVEDKEYDIIIDAHNNSKSDNDHITFLEEHYEKTESISKDILSRI